VFSDLVIEIYRDTGTDTSNDVTLNSTSTVGEVRNASEKVSKEKQPVATIKAHKLIVSFYSKYLHTMLTSRLREGSDNTIRLTTPYPDSLRRLLLSFYERSLEVGSEEELTELFFLADEYDVPSVLTVLKGVFPLAMSATGIIGSPISNDTQSTTPKAGPLAITLPNARLFLDCSAKIGLNLEPLIFAGLARQWWEFAPQLWTDESNFGKQRRYCSLLLDSLKFIDTPSGC
jgi:hypothetical protein